MQMLQLILQVVFGNTHYGTDSYAIKFVPLCKNNFHKFDSREKRSEITFSCMSSLFCLNCFIALSFATGIRHHIVYVWGRGLVYQVGWILEKKGWGRTVHLKKA